MSHDLSQETLQASRGDAREERRRARKAWPLRWHRLGEEPEDDLAERTTPTERLGMVWPLTVTAWRLSGRPIPDYARADTPGRVLRERRSE